MVCTGAARNWHQKFMLTKMSVRVGAAYIGAWAIIATLSQLAA